jgi:hypothetical protein
MLVTGQKPFDGIGYQASQGLHVQCVWEAKVNAPFPIKSIQSVSIPAENLQTPFAFYQNPKIAYEFPDPERVIFTFHFDLKSQVVYDRVDLRLRLANPGMDAFDVHDLSFKIFQV